MCKDQKFEDGDGEVGVCPVCGNEDLTYEEMRADNVGNIYPWKCNQCGAEGEETYEVTFQVIIIKTNRRNCINVCK